MHRCLTKTKITTGHPLSIKLQRKHHRKDSTETVQWQEKRGRIWRATCSDGAVEWKSFSLNKHERDGSHNHREVEAGGWHIWAGGGPALILWTEGSSHSGVNWDLCHMCHKGGMTSPMMGTRSAAKPDVPADASLCSHPICLSVIGKTRERPRNALRAAGGHAQCTDLTLSSLQCEQVSAQK